MLGATELLVVLVLLALHALAVGAVLALVPRATRSGARGSTEARLRELDDLRARGVISDEEHARARARALGG